MCHSACVRAGSTQAMHAAVLSTWGRAERSSVQNEVGHAVYACMRSYTSVTPAIWWAPAACCVCQAWPGLVCSLLAIIYCNLTTFMQFNVYTMLPPQVPTQTKPTQTLFLYTSVKQYCCRPGVHVQNGLSHPAVLSTAVSRAVYTGIAPRSRQVRLPMHPMQLQHTRYLHATSGLISSRSPAAARHVCTVHTMASECHGSHRTGHA